MTPERLQEIRDMFDELLDENERLQKEYDTALKVMQSLYEPRIDELKTENERLQKELGESREHYRALELNWLRYHKALKAIDELAYFKTGDSNVYKIKVIACQSLNGEQEENGRPT